MSTATDITRRFRRPGYPALALGLSLGLGLGLATAGCSSDPPILMVEIITGKETDTFSQEPKVTRVDITAIAADGDVSLKASAAPGGSFDFGEVPEDRLVTFDVTGVDATEAIVVRGRSLGGILLSAVGGGLVPVFAQRLNQWTRPPDELLVTHVDGTATTLAERYLVLTGGSSALSTSGGADPARTQFYDLFAYAGAAGPIMPRAARSVVARSSALLLIDDKGASWIDFDTGTYIDMELPAGLTSFADVAGGKTVDAPDGRSFVIGATKRGSGSQAVLVVAVDGSLAALTLPAPRAGAAALWLDGVGLVIAGGNATEPGVEVLSTKGTAFASRPFPVDATEGAVAVVTDPQRLTLLGGVFENSPAATRTLDLRCTSACTPAIEPAAAIPVAIAGAAAYSLGSGKAILVGDEATGDAMTRTFLVDLTEPSIIELPLREPRRGAKTVPAPNGTLGLLGGVHADGTPALSVEMLFPP